MKILYTKKLSQLIVGLCLLLVTNSCNKAMDIDSSHLVGEENQWKSITDSRSALLGVYGLFRAAIADNNGHWMWGELREGDLQSFVRQDLKAINENRLNSSYELVNSLKSWRRFYAIINSANLFIEKVHKVQENDPLYTPNNMKIDIAQVRVIRALAYFYMTRIWGDVPLITKAYDNGTFPEFGQSKADIVLAFAEREILASVNDLEYLYGVDGQRYYSHTSDRWNGVLMTKNSAYAILAHIAAWRGNYIDTEVYTKFVMDNYTKSNIRFYGIGELVRPDGFFNDKNASQIVAFNFVDAHGESSVGGHLEQMTLAYPLVNKNEPDLYVPKDTIINTFNDPQNRDVRFGIDKVSGLVRTNYFTNYSSATPIFSKIKVIRGGTTDGDYAIFGSAIVITRLDDIALLRAEALAVLNRSDEALTILNNRRGSRSLPSIFVETKEELIKEIFTERRRELMGEGHRWYDQVRLNKIVPLNTKIVSLIQNEGIYWPIAKDVLANNRLLKQNEFWK